MSGDSPSILTIGGFDPSNGAGISADIKTMMSLGVYGYAVQTCLTIQHEHRVDKVYWHDMQKISEQLEIVFEAKTFDWVKVSLTESLDSLLQIIHLLKKLNPEVRIIWDPVMVSSSGFSFQDASDHKALASALSELYLVTPNWTEMAAWSSKEPLKTAADLSQWTNVLLKGGHHPENRGTDHLFLTEGNHVILKPKRISAFEKHGSGCFLSAAILSYLVLGTDLETACRKAKVYTLEFLDSHSGLLGRHDILLTRQKVSVD
jgi:hydroxymethylpyrimidine/phosphomethylpyrimidine kinase